MAPEMAGSAQTVIPSLESCAVIVQETDGGNKDGNRKDRPTGLSVGVTPSQP